MRHRIYVLAVLGLSTMVCAASVPSDDDQDRREREAVRHPANNSGRNVRDRSGARLTAQKQPSTGRDVALTRQIRQAIVKDKALSTSAHNVKIITVNGVVTLRGPVQSEGEKTAVAARATQVHGVKRVDNQLEVAGG